MIAVGQSIGNYRILSKIGTGGMGAVYLAEHPLIGKKVAFKVIHRELASNREVVQRFFQEAQAVNKIGNAHIVEIHDFGVTPEGDHFFIMEYLEGQNLAGVLGRESILDIVRALHIGAQIASALGAAHASGVIHRDLKPDNVMLTLRLGDPDFVKLLDFGLAKIFSGEGQSTVKTAAGVLLGTPQYMSPEACESRGHLDHRADIYALGVLLFQMMTGVLPFEGETMGEVLVKQVTQLPPPPRGLNSNIPSSVEQIVLRCLAKQPDARFQTMLALREALLDPERYLHQSPPIAPARSVAPGEMKVDAKTIKAYAAQAELKTRVELPLNAPPSMYGDQPTLVAESGLAGTRAGTHRSDLDVPVLKTNTMRIATPLGYSSRTSRRAWPIVLVIALLLGLGGGAFAVAWFGHREPDARGSAPVGDASAGSAVIAMPRVPDDAFDDRGGSPVVATADAGQPPIVATPVPVLPVPPPTTVVVVIDSAPQGAEVFGIDHKSLGKTPLRLTLPFTKSPATFELRLAGYHPKVERMIVTENTVIEVPLDKLAPAITRHVDAGAGSGRGRSDDLERP